MAKGTITIENARLMFRNFAGKEQTFNTEGNRNFCVVLSPEDGDNLQALGWNVRYLSPRDPDESPLPYLQVTVEYDKGRPPKIVQITSQGKTVLDRDTIANLDWAEFENVDLQISPYHYEVGGRTGIKAYLQSMYVTLVEDELEKKYYDVPER